MEHAERVLLEQLEQKIRLWRREYGAFGSLSGQSLNEMDESAIGLAALLRALPQTVKASDTTASSEEKQEPRWPSDYGGHRFVGEVCDRCGIPEFGASGYVVGGRCPGNPLTPLRYRCERCGRVFRSGEKMCSSSQCLTPARHDATPAPSGDAQKELRSVFTNEVIRAIGALARQQNVCREQAGQVVFVTGMEAAREYIIEQIAASQAPSAPAVIAELIEAAKRADWMQVVLNQGPPCFHRRERHDGAQSSVHEGAGAVGP